jgi:hypothetical protein
MAKNSMKKFRGMLSSHAKAVPGKKRAPRATREEMDAIEGKASTGRSPSKVGWAELAIKARPVPGGAPGLRSQTRRKH